MLALRALGGKVGTPDRREGHTHHLLLAVVEPSVPTARTNRGGGLSHSNGFTRSPLLSYQWLSWVTKCSRPMREKCVFALRRNKHSNFAITKIIKPEF